MTRKTAITVVAAPKAAGMKIQASRIENGIEICNTCVRPANDPYRYKNAKGETRGCVSECHDTHVGRDVNPHWMAKRKIVIPKWIREARAAIKQCAGR